MGTEQLTKDSAKRLLREARQLTTATILTLALCQLELEYVRQDPDTSAETVMRRAAAYREAEQLMSAAVAAEVSAIQQVSTSEFPELLQR